MFRNECAPSRQYLRSIVRASAMLPVMQCRMGLGDGMVGITSIHASYPCKEWYGRSIAVTFSSSGGTRIEHVESSDLVVIKKKLSSLSMSMRRVGSRNVEAHCMMEWEMEDDAEENRAAEQPPDPPDDDADGAKQQARVVAADRFLFTLAIVIIMTSY